MLQKFISDHSLDILSLTETWLPPEPLPATLNSFTRPGYSLIHSPRLTGKGGGIAVIYRSFLKIVQISLPVFTSFEALCVKLSCSSSFFILTIYRPPLSNINTFMSELSLLLEDFASSPSELLINGDFNIHVDNSLCSSASNFLTLLDTFGLTQHVSFPTHTAGHTLDHLITRSSSPILSNIKSNDPILSDHLAVLSTLTTSYASRSPCITKQIHDTILLILVFSLRTFYLLVSMLLQHLLFKLTLKNFLTNSLLFWINMHL